MRLVISKTSFENLIAKRPRLEIFFKVIIAGSESSVLFAVEFAVDAIGTSEDVSVKLPLKKVALAASVVIF